MRPVSPSPTRQISIDGTMTQEFRTWVQAVSVASPIIGVGPPEGVYEAGQGELYLDTAGNAGSVLYCKRDPDLLGDKTKGWLPV